MVFLFPGILFRRSFFSGNFTNHFESGNPLERFLWNMLTSVFVLTVFTICLGFLSDLSNNLIGFDVKSSDILEVFICLYENKFPIYLNNYFEIKNVLKLLGSIYFTSIALGILFNKIIFIFKLDKTFKSLDFNRNWDNLVASNKFNNISHKHGDITITDIDIKTKENELFTGRFHNIIYNKDGNVYSISLTKTYKYYKIDKTLDGYENLISEIKKRIKKDPEFTMYHSESKNDFIYRKRIKGNVFVILADKIENISITYVKIGNVYDKISNYIQKFTVLSILLISLFIFSNAFWDFHIFNFSSENKRITFSIVTPLIILSLYNIFSSIIKSVLNKEKYKSYKADFWILFILLIPNLYIYNILNFGVVLTILLVALTVIPNNKEKGENSNVKVEINDIENQITNKFHDKNGNNDI